MRSHVRTGRSTKARHAYRSRRFTRAANRHYRGRYVQQRRVARAVGSKTTRRAAHQATAGWQGQEGGQDQRYAAGGRYASSGSNSSVVAEARRWLGTNPTRRRSLWCAAFMNFVLERTGHRGTGSDLARSFASAGRRVSGPQVGAIAVMSRRGGGHVGVVSGVDGKGNPIIISGNHRKTVAEAVYPRGRVYAYVMPQ